MMNRRFSVGKLPQDEIRFFERVNPGYICTGETLHEEFPEGGSQTLVVFKGKVGHNWTRYSMCRDCGDHYIIARWSRYDRVDKATLKLTLDVEDR